SKIFLVENVSLNGIQLHDHGRSRAGIVKILVVDMLRTKGEMAVQPFRDPDAVEYLDVLDGASNAERLFAVGAEGLDALRQPDHKLLVGDGSRIGFYSVFGDENILVRVEPLPGI